MKRELERYIFRQMLKNVRKQNKQFEDNCMVKGNKPTEET